MLKDLPAETKGPNLLQIFNEKCCIQSFFQSLILKSIFLGPSSSLKIVRRIQKLVVWSQDANISKFSVNLSRRDFHVSGNKSVSWFIIFDIKTYMQTYSNSGAYITCCLKYINCCKINICLNQFLRFWHKTQKFNSAILRNCKNRYRKFPILSQLLNLIVFFLHCRINEKYISYISYISYFFLSQEEVSLGG